MTHTRSVLALVGATLLLAGAPSLASAAAMTAAEFMKAANTNGDSTLSKDEVDAYARKRFAALETDKDKTLDQKELKGRLSEAGMTAADPDKDKTVDEAEFVGYADTLFAEANKKGDKTLSVEELGSPAGEKLIALLH